MQTAIRTCGILSRMSFNGHQLTMLMLIAAILGCQPNGDSTTDTITDTIDTASSSTNPSDTGPSDTGPSDTGEPKILPVEVVINEFMASNSSSWSPDGKAWPDWIELYNAGESPVDLQGMSISDDREDPTAHVFLGSLVMEPGGFVLLNADGDQGNGLENLPFKLGREGEEIALFSAEGVRIDLVVFGEQQPDIAAARVVDGEEDAGWEYVWRGTPGSSNAAR